MLMEQAMVVASVEIPPPELNVYEENAWVPQAAPSVALVGHTIPKVKLRFW
jgi:hypothetical protein